MQSKFTQNLRLAGFPLGLGLTSVLVSGTLNRARPPWGQKLR